MFPLGVPVPGTISADAPRAREAMNADRTPSTTVVSNARKLRTMTRADLRMRQRSHKGAAAAGGTWKLLRQPPQTMSDSRGAVRRRGREWTTRVLLTAGR